MKYVLLVYSNPARWVHPMFLNQPETLSAEERDARVHQFTTLLSEITESGELVASGALGDPERSRTVRLDDDGLAITDGPFADMKEHLAGYFVVDCDAERAAEIAARFPASRHSAVEVRPIVDAADIQL